MNQEKYIKYISKGQDPWKEEFNNLAKAINVVLDSGMCESKKLETIEKISDEIAEEKQLKFKL